MHMPKLYPKWGEFYCIPQTWLLRIFIYLLFNSKYSALENIKERPERFRFKDVCYNIVKGKKETQSEQ